MQAVNFLHFVDEVLLQILRSADLEDFVRDHRTFGQLLAFLHEVALEDNDVLAQRNEVFLFGAGLGVLEDQLAFAANRAADFDDAVDLRDLRSVFRTAGFEQFGHTRQTAGDVFGLGDFSRRLGEERAGANLVAFASTMTCAPAGIE